MSDNPFPSNRGDYPTTNIPIPTGLSQLVNDVGFVTSTQLIQQINYAIGSPMANPRNPALSRGITSLFTDNITTLANYGGVGDGIIDNSVALQAAAAVNDPAGVYVPAGIYNSSLNANSFNGGKFVGPGQTVNVRSNPPFNVKHISAPYHVVFNTPITSIGSAVPTTYRANNTSVWPPFPTDQEIHMGSSATLDISRILFPIDYTVLDINGQHTLGAPATGYQWVPEASVFNVSYKNTSGWNQSNSQNDGRTSVSVYKNYMTQSGSGDAVIFNGEIQVGNPYQLANITQPATNFLACPAGIFLNADITANTSFVYLNAAEYHISDSGWEVSAIAHVVNFFRSSDEKVINNTWIGERLQSLGSLPVDAGFSAVGLFKIGIDFVTVTFDINQSAITMGAGQRIYLNGTNSDPDGFPHNTNPGNIWFEYDASTSKIVFGNGSTRIFSVDGSGNAVFKGTVTSSGSP